MTKRFSVKAVRLLVSASDNLRPNWRKIISKKKNYERTTKLAIHAGAPFASARC